MEQSSTGVSASQLRSPIEVFDEGFTELWSPPNALADIIFIHGLQGHPKRTWTFSVASSPNKAHSALSKLVQLNRKSSSTDTTNEKTCFWLEDLLPQDFPNCRIATYGYDSRISNFFRGPANQANIVDHGTSLLNALEAMRRDFPERPIIFVAHSLGGLILKEALRRSWQATSYEEDLQTVYESTAAVIFMGTPHRGSQYAPWGMIVRNIAVASGFDASDRNLRDLKIDSPVLELLREAFSKMLKEERFDIYTFQEGRGFRGVRGLTGKVVEDVSSALDDARERRDFINANHMDMCRLSGPKDAGYRKVKEVLSKCIRRSQLNRPCIESASGQPSMYSAECRAALASLNAPETRNRFEQVDAAQEQTFDWIYDRPELEFNLWLKDERRLYWIQGKPASGKSTLMKFVYNDHRTDNALFEAEGKTVRAAFFFHDRGSHIQKSFNGLLHSILYQILSSVPELLPHIIPAYRTTQCGDTQTWELDHLLRAFDGIISQTTIKISAYLFLDALDEYSGDHEGMAKFLHRISEERPESKTLVKVCFSSRPLQIFLDKFKDLPGFRLQDYTEHDISTVIRARMEENERFRNYLYSPNVSNRHAVENIAGEIINRADGVFLWVKLVLDELMEEFRAGADLQKLHEKLLIIPTDLETYYQRIIDKIPPRYRDESQIMFAILACALDAIYLHDFIDTFKYASVERLSDCLRAAREPYEQFLDSTDRLIRSRSGGLIEIKAVTEDNQYHSLSLGGPNKYVVQFIHQTVKTFSLRPDPRSQARTTLSPRRNGYVYLLKFILVHVSRLAVAKIDHCTGVWLEALLNYAKLAEITTNSSQGALLSQVEDRQIAYFYTDLGWSGEMRYPLIESLLSLAVVADLQLFLTERCTADIVQRKLKIPLLHLAVDEQLRGRTLFGDSPIFDEEYDRAAVVDILLERGANAKELVDNKTAFQTLLSSRKHWGPVHAKMIDVFLKHHEDPNVRIKWRERIRRRRLVDRESPVLHLAIIARDNDSVSCLLRYGAKVNSLDSQGQTPLDLACRHLGSRVRHFLSLNIPNYPWLDTDETRAYSPDLPDILSTIRLLLERGAKRNCKPFEESVHDEYHFDQDIPITAQDVVKLKELGLDVNDWIMNLPQLQPGLSERILNVVVATSSIVTSRWRT